MYSTFKKIMAKHTTEEDILVWKGFLLGILIAVFTVGPLVSLSLIFIFHEHTDLDEIIAAWLSKFVGIWFN